MDLLIIDAKNIFILFAQWISIGGKAVGQKHPKLNIHKIFRGCIILNRIIIRKRLNIIISEKKKLETQQKYQKQ